MITWGTIFSLWAITLGGMLIMGGVAWHTWWIEPVGPPLSIGLAGMLVVQLALPVKQRKRKGE